jgi:hypothetical protein
MGAWVGYRLRRNPSPVKLRGILLQSILDAHHQQNHRPGSPCRVPRGSAAFQLQCVAGFQVKFFSQRFGNDGAASFAFDEANVHTGMIIG